MSLAFRQLFLRDERCGNGQQSKYRYGKNTQQFHLIFLLERTIRAMGVGGGGVKTQWSQKPIFGERNQGKIRQKEAPHIFRKCVLNEDDCQRAVFCSLLQYRMSLQEGACFQYKV